MLDMINVNKRVHNLLNNKSLLNNPDSRILSVTLGGSHSSGLATLHSDIDVRVLKMSTMEDLFGLHPFEHIKIVEGESSINDTDDLDIEVYSTKRFFKDLYHGEIIVNEMLGIRESETIFEDKEIINDIKSNISLFKSKKFIFKNLGFYKGCYHQVFSDVEKVKSHVRKNRILTYGYDTKKAEQSIRSLEIIEDYLLNDHFSVYRENNNWLLSIREGLMSLDEYKKYVEEKHSNVMKLIDNSNLPKQGDFEKVNSYVINFHKKFN